ncbi:hypothetical protein MRX96_012848 [Rhipicephalus microplus]
MLNVTVRKTYYRRRIDITQQMFEGNVDVFGSIIAVNSESYRNFAIPPIIATWYESFYAKRLPPLPLSFYVVLKESKVALLLVAVTLLLTLFVLVAADMDRIREWSFDSLAVSFSFLLAAFYATSSTVPRIGRFASMCGFECGLWLMGIQPFSSYFREQLTSRVTLRTIPEQLDNIEKLERALDEDRVSPCVVGKTFLHERLLDSFSADSVHRKLHLAFVRNNDAMGLTPFLPYVRLVYKNHFAPAFVSSRTMKLTVTLIAFAIVGIILHDSSAAPAGQLAGASSEEAQRTVRYNDDAVARVSVACVNNICSVSQLRK